MIFRQDIKKIYVRAIFLFGTFITMIVYGVSFNEIIFGSQDIIFLIILLSLLIVWFLSYYWYYFEVTQEVLIRKTFGMVKSIPISSITELSYEDNPARPIVYVVFKKRDESKSYIEFTTGLWSPFTLHSLNEILTKENPNIIVKFDEKTQKNFEKDRAYHLGYPKNIFSWILLGSKQLSLGVLMGIILILVLKYL